MHTKVFARDLFAQAGYKSLAKTLEMTPHKNLVWICTFNGMINFIKNPVPGKAKFLKPTLTKKETNGKELLRR